MGWSIGFDSDTNRDIGYGVPAYCDHPGCTSEIDRGLAYACGGEHHGGERGCGLYFCGDHLTYAGARVMGKRVVLPLCARCTPRVLKPFSPSSEHPDWLRHKLGHSSWRVWRRENPEEVARLKGLLAAVPLPGAPVAVTTQS